MHVVGGGFGVQEKPFLLLIIFSFVVHEEKGA